MAALLGHRDLGDLDAGLGLPRLPGDDGGAWKGKGIMDALTANNAALKMELDAALRLVERLTAERDHSRTQQEANAHGYEQSVKHLEGLVQGLETELMQARDEVLFVKERLVDQDMLLKVPGNLQPGASDNVDALQRELLTDLGSQRKESHRLKRCIVDLSEAIHRGRLDAWRLTVSRAFERDADIPKELELLLKDSHVAPLKVPQTTNSIELDHADIRDVLQHGLETQRTKYKALQEEYAAFRLSQEKEAHAAASNYKELQASFSTLSDTHHDLLSKFEILQSETSDLTTTHSQLHNHLSELQLKHLNSTSELEAAQELIDELEANLSRTTLDKDRLKVSFEKAIAKLSFIIEEANYGKETVAQLEKTLARYEEQILELERGSRKFKEELERNRDEYSTYRDEVVMVQELCEKNQTYLEAVIAKTVDVTINNETRVARPTEETKPRSHAHMKALDQTDYIEALEESLQTFNSNLEKEKIKLHGKILDLTRERDGLQEKMLDWEKDLANLESQVAESNHERRQIVEWREKATTLKSKLDESVADRSEKEKVVDILNKDKQCLLDMVSQLRAEVAKGNDASKRQRAELARNRTVVEDLRAQVAELTRASQALEHKIKSNLTSLAIKGNLIRDLKAKAVEGNDAALQESKDQLAEAQKGLRKASAQLTKEAASVRALTLAVSSLEKETHDLKHAKGLLVQRHEQVSRSLNACKSQLVSQQSSLETDVKLVREKTKKLVEDLVVRVLDLRRRTVASKRYLAINEHGSRQGTNGNRDDESDPEEALLVRASVLSQKYLNVEFGAISDAEDESGSAAMSEYWVQRTRDLLRHPNFDDLMCGFVQELLEDWSHVVLGP